MRLILDADELNLFLQEEDEKAKKKDNHAYIFNQDDKKLIAHIDLHTLRMKGRHAETGVLEDVCAGLCINIKYYSLDPYKIQTILCHGNSLTARCFVESIRCDEWATAPQSLNSEIDLTQKK